MKGLIHKKQIDLYFQPLEICFHAETHFKRVNLKPEPCGGHTNWNIDSGVISIYIEKNDKGCISVSTAAHEAFHAADFIFEKVGAVIQEGTGNEHMAYLIGHIVDLIFDCLEVDNKAEFGE